MEELFKEMVNFCITVDHPEYRIIDNVCLDSFLDWQKIIGAATYHLFYSQTIKVV